MNPSSESSDHSDEPNIDAGKFVKKQQNDSSSDSAEGPAEHDSDAERVNSSKNRIQI